MDLAIRRIEKFHLDLLVRYIEAHRTVAPDAGSEVHRGDHAIALYDALGLETRVTGFVGADKPSSDEADALLHWLVKRWNGQPAAGIRVELGPNAHASHRQYFESIGCVHESDCAVFRMELPGEVTTPDDGLEIIWADSTTMAETIHTIGRGFADGGEPRDLQLLAGTAYSLIGEHVLARRDGVSMAGAALFLSGTVAYLSGMSVLPRFRGQHLQTRLIQERFKRAWALGAREVFVSAAPGGRSRRNLERAGFEFLYQRESLRFLPK